MVPMRRKTYVACKSAYNGREARDLDRAGSELFNARFVSLEILTTLVRGKF